MPSIQIPEPPIREQEFTARAWVRWFQELRRTLATQVTTAVDWIEINFTGSNITDLATRKHTDLQDLNTASYTHLSAANHTDLTDGGTTTLHSHDVAFKSPASITLNTGTGTGSVTDLQTMLDGNVYHIDEVVGVPGFDLEVNFTTVTRIRGVQTRFFYDGTATHDVHVEMRNYATSAWDVMTSVNGTPDYVTLMWWLPSAANYIDGSGNSIVRFYHVTSGNAAHNIDIDYVGLIV